MNRLWANRKLLRKILGVIEDVLRSAKDIADFRAKLVERVQAGDLDDAVAKFAEAKRRADDYIRGGRKAAADPAGNEEE